MLKVKAVSEKESVAGEPQTKVSKKSRKRSKKQTPYDVFNKAFDDLMEAKESVHSLF